jgi:hypothetical protein
MATRRRSARLFSPTTFNLEDRVVPASYYVDNAFAGHGSGDIVTFNAGQSNQVTGLVFNTNAFADIPHAIAKANLDAAADTVFVANGTYTLDPTANGGAFLVFNPLDLIGSGKSATTIMAASDSTAASGTNGALIAAQNTTFNASQFTLDGGFGSGHLVASGLRYEDSIGTVSTVTIQSVRDDSNTASVGYGVVVTGSGSDVTVTNSSLIVNGRGGVRFDDGAQGSVKASTLQGRGGPFSTDINFGVDITDGSSVLVTGNTITGFTGNDGTFTSAGVQVASTDPARPASATVLGNTISNNDTGIIVGIGNGDASTADIEFNNILNNNATGGLGSGVFTDTTGTVTALNNFWGDPTGPQAPDNANGNGTSSVTAGVTYKSATITQPPQGIATGTLPVVVSSTPSQAAAAASPTVIISGPGTGIPSPITLTVTFSEAVSGFTASDIVLGGTAGPGTVTNLTTTNNITYTVTVSGLNTRGTLTVGIPAGAATAGTGLGNLVGSANIPFQAPFDRGFAAAGDAGASTPTFGVTDTFSTRLGVNAFGSGYTGGERVATGDFNGDGTLDYAIASGTGGTTTVVVIDGVTQKQTFAIVPFGNSFTHGAYVSAGDLTGDGRAELIISAERGGGARVRIFSPNAAGQFNQISDFIGIIGSDGKPDTSFRGGARTAVGDFNGDGHNDLAFAAGTGGGPRIALFNGVGLGLNGGPKLCGDFFVFEPTLRNGSYVAAGDLNGDGRADLIVGAGNGAARVRVINGATLISSNGATVTAMADFFAFGSTGRSGARVAAEDLDGDGKIDVIAAPGPDDSNIRVFSGANLLANGSNPAITKELNLFGSFTGGVFVG